jgi:hypothetical protein
MKTKTINLYSFNELSEQAQQKAIENLYDINVTHEWWDFTYEDAENIGLKITEFDLDRNRHANGEFIFDVPVDVANAIKNNHGEQCETYKTAIKFIAEWDNLVATHSDGIETDRVCEDKEYDFDNAATGLEQDFLKALLEDYSLLLQKEYEYLTSKEAIIETINANEYTFTESGKLENL